MISVFALRMMVSGYQRRLPFGLTTDVEFWPTHLGSRRSRTKAEGGETRNFASPSLPSERDIHRIPLRLEQSAKCFLDAPIHLR